jgi:fatty acid desaturase
MRNRFTNPSWMSIIFSLLSNINDNIRETVRHQIEYRRRMMLRKIVAGFLMLFGLIYFLNGIVMVINKFSAGNPWVGWLMIGLILLLVGYFVGGKNRD